MIHPDDFYYCNIITPAGWDGIELRWIDLDLDIGVQADDAYRLLDEDEWTRNAERLNELSGLVARREFPFDALKSD